MGSCMSMTNEGQLGGAGGAEKMQIRRMCSSNVEESMRKKSKEDHVGRIYRSDEDRGRYIAEPDADRKAEDFINLFHRNRVMDETTALSATATRLAN